MADAAPLRVTEVAFAKNEGRFFLEWIAYHRLIGATDFLIYTNDCEDESPALLDRLAEMGLVTHVPNPIAPGEQPQNKALSRAASHPLVLGADYVLQIDIDEFLCIKAGEGQIADLIATAPQSDGICVQMRFFGDNGLVCLTEGLVMNSLTGTSHESFELNDIVKTLARNSAVFERVTANHMPTFGAKWRQAPRMFNCGGREIPPETYGGARFRKIPDAYRSMRFAQLNHYAVRTFDCYRAKKYRGTAANNDRKLSMGYWQSRNRNEVQDTTILRHAPQVQHLVSAWLRDPVLERCNRRCFEAFAEILRKSENVFADVRQARPTKVMPETS